MLAKFQYLFLNTLVPLKDLVLNVFVHIPPSITVREQATFCREPCQRLALEGEPNDIQRLCKLGSQGSRKASEGSEDERYYN